MSELLSEELRKLQGNWLDEANQQTPTSAYERGRILCAAELTPLIALAEAQEREIAALHEQVMRYQADPQYDARFIEGQDKTEAALKGQHSADLREVAEGIETAITIRSWGQAAESLEEWRGVHHD